MADIAAALGTPFMPWQRQVADVALEIRPDGLPAYRRVVLTVPRQSGKTTLLLSTLVHRALAWSRPQVMVYAAQNGVETRKKFVDDQLPILARSPFRPLYKPRLTSGHEAVLWKNGSRHLIAASTEKTGHGPTLDLGVIDEAFAQVDARLEQAFSPAMITRRDAQLWVVSTAGTLDSVYLWEKVDNGRANHLDIDGGTAFFEWSAPDDADPEDPATWWACMPALGITVTEDVVRSELAGMPRAEFCRAYLNQWTATSEGAVIPPKAWAEHRATYPQPPNEPLTFALDVSPMRDWSAISVCGMSADGDPQVEITSDGLTLDHRPNTEWVVPRMRELVARWDVREVTIVANSQAETLREDLEGLGLDIVALTGAEFAQACGVFYDAATTGNLRHLGQPDLDRALELARARESEAGWTWGRRKSAGDITPIIAATLAAAGCIANTGEVSVMFWDDNEDDEETQ